MTTVAPERKAPTHTPLDPDESADAEALFEEARRRQRRRRRLVAAVVVLAIGMAVLAYAMARGRDGSASSTSSSVERPGVASGTALVFRLAGFGTPQPTTVGQGPCPQGRTVIPIMSLSGARVGTDSECVLTVRKIEAAGTIRTIVETVTATYRLPRGTINTHETHRVLFSADQKVRTVSFHGTIVGGTGRYARAHGDVQVRGASAADHPQWAIRLRVR